MELRILCRVLVIVLAALQVSCESREENIEKLKDERLKEVKMFKNLNYERKSELDNLYQPISLVQSLNEFYDSNSGEYRSGYQYNISKENFSLILVLVDIYYDNDNSLVFLFRRALYEYPHELAKELNGEWGKSNKLYRLKSSNNELIRKIDNVANIARPELFLQRANFYVVFNNISIDTKSNTISGNIIDLEHLYYFSKSKS